MCVCVGPGLRCSRGAGRCFCWLHHRGQPVEGVGVPRFSGHLPSAVGRGRSLRCLHRIRPSSGVVLRRWPARSTRTASATIRWRSWLAFASLGLPRAVPDHPTHRTTGRPGNGAHGEKAADRARHFANDESDPGGSGASCGRVVGETRPMRRRQSCARLETGGWAFAGFQFPLGVILLAVRWYLRFGLSYRDLEELLVERGVEVDHVTLFRWVQRFAPQLVEAARPCRHAAGGRWFVDETYVKVAGRWRYVYRAVDETGQVLDVMVFARRDLAAARRFFAHAAAAHGQPVEVTTDLAPSLLTAVAEAAPDTFHDTAQHANNRIECDHGRLKARLRPMHGLKTERGLRIVASRHAFVQNIRRGHYASAPTSTRKTASPPRSTSCSKRSDQRWRQPPQRARLPIQRCNSALEPAPERQATTARARKRPGVARGSL